jgi:hypothetical protein
MFHFHSYKNEQVKKGFKKNKRNHFLEKKLDLPDRYLVPDHPDLFKFNQKRFYLSVGR